MGYHRARMGHRFALLIFLHGACLPCVIAQQGDTDATALIAGELELRNATIREIRYNIGNVFDTSNPEETKRLHRWANRVHIRSKQSTIESIILPEIGDRFDARESAESARLLRARGFITDSNIVPVEYDEATNSVALEVTTIDSWSLSPDLKFSRTGGINEWGIGASEENLFGLGKEVTLSRTSDIDRDETFIGYVDPNIRGSRTRLNAVFADASDGHRTQIVVGRPFYALDSRWAIEASLTDIDRVDPIYNLGEVIDRFRDEIETYSVWGGWSRGLRNRRTVRWLVGITSDTHRFSEAPNFANPILQPLDRELVYPWVGLQIADDDFRQVRELNDMGRTEDVSLGLNLTMRVGRTSDSHGSDRDATIFFASASKGWEPGGVGRLLLFNLNAQARDESVRGTRNSIVTGTLRYFRRNMGRHLLSVTFGTTIGNRIDAEKQILLGGDSDLRGYPLRYQSGESRAIFSIEQRFFMDWYPFRLVRMGWAVFAGAGRVWGDDPRGTPNLGTLYDIGIGLRFTSPRSSGSSVVHLDLAFPVNAPGDVDSYQLTIEKKRSF